MNRENLKKIKTVDRSIGRMYLLILALLLGTCSGSASMEPDSQTGPNAGNHVEESEPAQSDVSPPNVANFTRIDDTVACAGETPPEAMAELKQRGFVSIINFRTVNERGATPESGQAAAEAVGLKYFHIPFRTPTTEIVERFLKTVSEPANQPIYIHCASANRVGAMWLIKRIKQDGWDVDRAITEAETIGLRSSGLREFALNYASANEN